MDRHGRMPRAWADMRRRPADGFRLAHRTRFAQLAAMVIHSLTGPVGRVARSAELIVEEVPAPEQPTVLAVFEPRSEAGSRLTLYRRPLELRAESKTDLVELLRETVRAEINGVLGLDDQA